MKQSDVTFRILFLIILNDAIDSLAQLFMKKGLIGPALPTSGFDIISFIVQNAHSPLLWFGIFLYAVNFFLWIFILSQIDLSLAIPLGSTPYLFIPILAVIFLHEKMSWIRWAASALIVAGICVLSRSKANPPTPLPAP